MVFEVKIASKIPTNSAMKKLMNSNAEELILRKRLADVCLFYAELIQQNGKNNCLLLHFL